MKKIHLQNLVAICDLAVKQGLIHPDDLINVGLSRKAAIDMADAMSDLDTLTIDRPEAYQAKECVAGEAKADK